MIDWLALPFYISSIAVLCWRTSIRHLVYIYCAICAGLVIHFSYYWRWITSFDNYRLGLFESMVYVTGIMLFAILLNDIRLRRSSAMLLMLLCANTALYCIILLWPQQFATTTALHGDIAIHQALSMLAYALMTIVAFIAVIFFAQSYAFKHHYTRGVLPWMPSLQTLEKFFITVFWAGIIALCGAQIAGIWLVQDIFAQHLSHKIFFSLLALGIYAVLLIGYYRHHWRGNQMVRWSLWAYLCFVISYSGTQWVLSLVSV